MNKNRITESVILALATLLSAFAWTGLRGFLFSNGGWILPLIGFFIICVLLSLGWLLLKSKIILATTLIIILFGYFIAFGFSWVYLIVALVALGFFFYGSIQAIDERDVRIKVKASKILKVGLPSLLTGLILLTVTAHYFSPLSMTDFEIPRPLFDVIMKIMPFPSMQADLNSFLSGLDVNDLENINWEELEKNDIHLEGFNLEKTGSMIEEAGGLENMLKNLPLNPSDDDMYEMINQIVHDYIEPYKKYLAIGWTVGLFFMLKTLSVPFMWLAIFFSWLIFKLLVLIGAIKIHEKSVLQEVIE